MKIKTRNFAVTISLFFSLLALGLLSLEFVSASDVNAQKSGNPIVPGYFADPCIRKFGDTYYLYATPDGWGVGAGPFCIWTSKDFVHWTAHKSDWPSTNEKWAPSVVFKNNKYYMYTQVPCKIFVATADNPLGSWKNPVPDNGVFIPDQTPKGTITLDGECFIDDDGQAYIYYGTWWTPTAVKLKPDLISTIPESAVQFFGKNTPNGTVKNCMEAPYMLKRNGIYYYMYSNGQCADASYQVEYSTGKSPLGPWTFGANNPILSTNWDQTIHGPGHHSIFEDGGKVYIVYHRHDNPHHPDGVHRQIAVDELIFNADGSIAKVVPTHDGIGYLAPSTKRDSNLAVGMKAEASSHAGDDWLPANAADENNGTLWKAAEYKYPQWLTVDLGSNMSFKRCETDFQFPQIPYKYRIEISADNKDWTVFADRSANSNMGGPMVDEAASPASGRYVRITMLGDDMPQRPNPEIGIWNFKVYDGVDKADPTPVVDAGPDKKGTMSIPALALSGSLQYSTGPTTYSWTKVSGPGIVTFSEPAKLATKATFSAEGTYVLQLSANDGTRTGKDAVTCTVSPQVDRIISYSMDEKVGVYVNDSSGNNQDGILINGPKRGTGAVNGAVSFDGKGGYINLPPLLKYPVLGLSAWIKPDGCNAVQAMLSGNGSTEGAPCVSIQADGKIHFTVTGNKPADISSKFAFTPATVGTWTHLAVVYSSTLKTVSFYVNGALDSSGNFETAVDVDLSTGARIGGWDGGGRNYEGKIDELVLFSRDPGSAEISKLASAATFSKVSDAKSMADGKSITLKAVPVTYAPVSSKNERSTNFFYVEDADGKSGMRVDDGKIGQDNVLADRGTSITGTMRTDKDTGERYLECTAVPEIESAPPVTPAATGLKNVLGDDMPGIIAKIANAKIDSISPDRKSMEISDGGQEKLTVICEYGTIEADLAELNSADITGAVSQLSPGKKVLLLKSYWRTNPPVDMMTYKLQEYFKFDENAGTTAVDSSGNNRNATVANPVWEQGKIGNALVFDGKKTTAVIPDMGMFPAITIAGWMNLSTLNDWQSVMHCDGWDPNDVHLSFRGSALFFSVNGNHPVDVGSAKIYDNNNLNTWQWIAVVYDSAAKSVNFYANGKPAGTNKYITAVSANLAARIHVGSWNGGDRFFGGKMDDLRFYGRALTEAEIKKLYDESSGK